MGIFNRQSRKKIAERSPVVTVAFRDLTTKDPLANFSPDHGYAYLWPFPETPRVGDWAVAPGWDGPASVIVGSLGLPASARGETLKPLLQRIPAKEVERVRAEKDHAAHRWLDHARQLVGLPLDHPAAAIQPPGFDPLPPAQGVAEPDTADEYGRVWWRAYNLAAELGRPSDEVAAFKAVGQGWFRLRDRAQKEDRDKRMSKTAAATDLEAAIRDVRNRPRAEVEKMLFAGQPLWDWLAYAQGLEREGRLEDALELLGALITAAEQEAEVSGREPAPAYTERAAIIHRKRRDYAAEIAVIERWAKACPPEKRGPGATQAKLLKRLERARELADKG
jgi:hypothetical protein